MTLWENWVRHPQSLWGRKALFRIHRWTGIGAGLYILMMSSSGSLIVYRDELTLAFYAGTRHRCQPEPPDDSGRTKAGGATTSP